MSCAAENIFTLLYNNERPAVMLHLTSGGLSDRTHSPVTGAYVIRECFGWTAALEEHSSNAADMAVLAMLCHRKRRAWCVGYMLCLRWYASYLQKSSSLISAGSQSKPWEYGWCPDSYVENLWVKPVKWQDRYDENWLFFPLQTLYWMICKFFSDLEKIS